MGNFINDHIGQIFTVIMILTGLGFVGSLIWNYSKSGSYTPSNLILVEDEFQVAIQHSEGTLDENGKDISFCVQGWDYLNKKKVLTISYKDQIFENGQVFRYKHLKDVFENCEIV